MQKIVYKIIKCDNFYVAFLLKNKYINAQNPNCKPLQRIGLDKLNCYQNHVKYIIRSDSLKPNYSYDDLVCYLGDRM